MEIQPVVPPVVFEVNKNPCSNGKQKGSMKQGNLWSLSDQKIPADWWKFLYNDPLNKYEAYGTHGPG